MNRAWDMLSEEVKSKIVDMGWDEFTEVQELSIPVILNNDSDVLIISETSSGKTEAAFLPLLSKISKERFYEGVKVLYISPLKALINDQFIRLEKLIEDMSIRLMKWHGDVSYSKKKIYLNNPSGILQTTPESLEGFLINRPYLLENILKDVEYIVIDEIHAFVGHDRGYHLQSILHRLRKFYNKRCRVIALSATIEDTNSFAKWINDEEPSSVNIINVTNSTKKTMFFISHNDTDKVIEEALVEDIFKLTSQMKALIFCNSRGEVEALCSELNELAGYEKYHPHHSNINKEQREYIEDIMKSGPTVSIIATSTLELGIDIGDVDIVIQINSTSEVSSLKQRVGRSGRKAGKNRILQLYSNSTISLLSSIASIELIKENKIEKPKITHKNYDYLFHQIISMCISSNGISAYSITKEILSIPVFADLSEDDVIKLINYMLETHYLEFIKSTKEFGVGIQGEKLLKGKEIYSFFETAPAYEVIYQNSNIGLLDLTPLMKYTEGYQFILAGRKWVITGVEHERLKIYVDLSPAGSIPRFIGNSVGLDEIIKNKVHYLLCNDIEISYLNYEGNLVFENIKAMYRNAEIKDNERLVYSRGNSNIIELFLNNEEVLTFYLILKVYKNINIEYDSLGSISLSNKIDISEIFNLNFQEIKIESVYSFYKKNIYLSKFSKYLPDDINCEMFEERFINLNGLKKSLNKIKLIKI